MSAESKTLRPEDFNKKEVPPGIERFSLIYREVKAEEMGLAVPNLAKLLKEEEESLVRAGVKDESIRRRFLADKHPQILRRWRSELGSLGSLIDPDEKKRIETEINNSLLRELSERSHS